ncbi:putative casparian strip membrane protein [Helianthus annuus]|nr:putative casparian strip membrane protein [Helianthus annuus]
MGVLGEFKRGVDVAHGDWFGVREGTHLLGEHPLHPKPLLCYLVGVSAAAGVHSLLQLLMTSRMLLRKSSIISSKKHAWLLFASDQVFAYAMMSCGSAASGVTNLNRTGIKHSSLPNFCKPLHSFCDRVAVSIAFAFFGCFLLAMSSVLDVVWLSAY